MTFIIIERMAPAASSPGKEPALRSSQAVSKLATWQSQVLSDDARRFVADLARRFAAPIADLLVRRVERRARIAAGTEHLGFLAETAEMRGRDWRVASAPHDLQRRAVEITGPTDRKMMINAFNSGADVFMADLEDSSAPTWANVLSGQINLYDAIRRTITWNDPETGKSYRLNDRTATLIVRPRGWHLLERHLLVDGKPVPGALVDAGFYLFHNAHALIERGTGPYLYLPKLETHREARLWNDVLAYAEKALEIPHGAIKATVLIETLPAAFEMDEILWELRDHIVGLNCGRWDYIFSFIKYLSANPAAVLPDRSQVTMEQPCMRAYTQLAVKTCHRRGAHAIGGMAAQIPIKNDPEANERALARVRADKLREVKDGHDGTWVAHPGLVPVAREIFDANMPGPNQLAVTRADVNSTADDLLRVPTGTRTIEGLRHNVRVGIQYIEAWLRGTGCVPLYHLMEDAATAEISRAQVWQWIHHRARLDDTGQVVDATLLERVVDEEMARITRDIGAPRAQQGRFDEARALFTELATAGTLADFLTSAAYAALDDIPPITID
ncbi:MAG TPA: malate synthase A [Gemmatimonadaceae bacterium]|nr:malate synthase A [Gemmatimonadaceae bacterium]